MNKIRSGLLCAIAFSTLGWAVAAHGQAIPDWARAAPRVIEFAKPDGVSLRLDLYAPKESAKPLPVVVWIHGGGWYLGGRDDRTFLPITREGFALVSIDYRLSQQAIFPAQIYDCKAAVRWVRANAAAYHLDPDNIGVVGGSSGGHLVALLGATENNPQFEGNEGTTGVSSTVKCVVDYFGPSDFTTIEKELATPQEVTFLDDMLVKLFGGPVALKVDLVRMASPLFYVSAQACPFFIEHGDHDTIIPLNQSLKLDGALKKAGVYSELHVIKGAIHGFADAETYDPAAYAAMLHFLKHYLQTP